MSTIYETKFYGPTDNAGARIKVTNMKTGHYKWHYWNYEVDYGQAQHLHALTVCAKVNPNGVTLGGETKMSYLWVAS